MVVHMTFNHLCMSSILLYPNGHMLKVDKLTSTQIVSIRVRLAVVIIIRISILIGKELPCHGGVYRFEAVLIRQKSIV